jgi:hypothetical protein
VPFQYEPTCFDYIQSGSFPAQKPGPSSHVMEQVIAKNQNTFAKQKREVDKRLKAEAKRQKRNKRKEERSDNPPPTSPPGQTETPEEPHP